MASVATITIDTPDGPMPAAWFGPRAEPAAVVVVCQEIFGVTDYIRRRCRDLVQEGYAVVAPQFYWRLAQDGVVPLVPETDDAALEQAMGLAQRLDQRLAVTDGTAVVAAMRARDATRGVGLLGFCWGGAVAFGIAAETRPEVLVSYYGSALPGMLDLAPQVTGPSLHHFGEADEFIGPDAQAEVRAAVTAHGAVWHSYPGANHAFDNDAGRWHHPQAAEAAWRTTTEFLAAHLGQG